MQEQLPKREQFLQRLPEIVEDIRKLTGLELTTIEGVGLRKILEDVWKRKYSQGDFDEPKIKGGAPQYSWLRIKTYAETFCVFLSKFYGVNVNSYDEFNALFPPDLKTFEASETTKEYFRKKQQEFHDPFIENKV